MESIPAIALGQELLNSQEQQLNRGGMVLRLQRVHGHLA
jgi:hypothetical protein